MAEQHNCNCSNNSNSEDLKRLELLAIGSKSEQTLKFTFKWIIIFFTVFVISLSITAIYGINRYYNYLMNTEVVHSVTTTEEYFSDDYSAGGHIIQGNSFDNSSVGAVNGENKESKK